MSTHHLHAAVDRCRNRLVGAMLYQLSGAQTRNSYAHWCDQMTRPYAHGPLRGGPGVAPNRKWLLMLDFGTQLRSDTLKSLQVAFPEVARVAANSLWQVLHWPGEDTVTPYTYLCERLPHCPALEHCCSSSMVNARMRWALGVPDWSRFTEALALLRSVAPRWTRQRAWLSEHFAYYVVLATLRPPCETCAADLWTLIDRWLRQGRTALPTGWATTWEVFEQQREQLIRAKSQLQKWGWLTGTAATLTYDLTLLWAIHLDEPSAYAETRSARRCPRRLHREVAGLVASETRKLIRSDASNSRPAQSHRPAVVSDGLAITPRGERFPLPERDARLPVAR